MINARRRKEARYNYAPVNKRRNRRTSVAANEYIADTVGVSVVLYEKSRVRIPGVSENKFYTLILPFGGTMGCREVFSAQKPL